MRGCENCGAKVPAGATVCPECGVFAGEYVEGQQAVNPPKPHVGLWLSILAAVVLVAAVSVWLTKPHLLPIPISRDKTPPRVDTAPVRVVEDRPGGARRPKGAKLSEPEAILHLRRHFTTLDPKCVAILSNGYRDGAYVLTAVNSCENTRLGKWRVDGRTGAVERAL